LRDTFNVVFIRYHLLKENTLIFQGFFPFDNPKGYELKLELNGKPYPMDITINEGNEVRRRYIAAHKSVSKEYVGEIALPQDLHSVKNLKLICTLGEDLEKPFREVVYMAPGKDLIKMQDDYQYNLERSTVTDNRIQVLGWAIGNVPEEIKLYDGNTETRRTEYRRICLFRVSRGRTWRRDSSNTSPPSCKSAPSCAPARQFPDIPPLWMPSEPRCIRFYPLSAHE